MHSPNDDAEWPPLSIGDVPKSVASELTAECPRGEVLKAGLLQLFEAQTGLLLSAAAQGQENTRDIFFRWWTKQVTEGRLPLDFRKWPRLEPLLYRDLSGKAIVLAQRQCSMCVGLQPPDALCPWRMVPLRIAAASRQVLDAEKWCAYQRAVERALDGRIIQVPTRICAAVTYVLDSSRRDPDLDNLTKATMDAFSRALGFNDRFIDHLDVAKLSSRKAEEFIIVRLAPSYLNEGEDVVVRAFHHSWAGQQTVTIDEFLRPDD